MTTTTSWALKSLEGGKETLTAPFGVGIQMIRKSIYLSFVVMARQDLGGLLRRGCPGTPAPERRSRPVVDHARRELVEPAVMATE